MSRTAKLGLPTALAIAAVTAGCDASAPSDLPTDAMRTVSTGEVRAAPIAMARGEIDVEGGVIHIVAPADGRLADVRVAPGESVTANQTLATFDTRAAALALDRARLAVSAAGARLQLAQSKRKRAQEQMSRVQQAQDADAASPQALDEARDSLAISEAEFADAQTSVDAARLQVRAAELDLDSKIIRAPLAGRIVERSLAARASLPVREGIELFLLVPSGPRIVRALVEEAFADAVHAGMRAEILSDSDPEHPYPAEVIQTGDVLRQHAPDPASNEPRDVRKMDCLLSVSAPELRIGQRVLVRFLRNS
jgi:multidrug resistance efflux pump